MYAAILLLMLPLLLSSAMSLRRSAAKVDTDVMRCQFWFPESDL